MPGSGKGRQALTGRFDHNRILNATAREVLKPLGLVRKGRSRTWLDDRGWWIGIVEFAPHGWMRGTFLTVAVDWLWHERDHLAYSVGGRVEHLFGEPPYEDFVEAKDEEQFRTAVRGLTMRAAEEVEGYRRRFSTVEEAARYLREHGDEDFWQAFDAGVVCGLLGRAGEARRWFERVAGYQGRFDWMLSARERAGELVALLDDPDAFRREIRAAIRRRRATLGLDPETELDGAIDPEKLERSWRTTTRRLEAARALLTGTTAEDPESGTLAAYEDYLTHNELELALDELEGVGKLDGRPPGFWRELLAAAENMGLREHAARYRVRLGRRSAG
jgi:hypothetical protein